MTAIDALSEKVDIINIKRFTVRDEYIEKYLAKEANIKKLLKEGTLKEKIDMKILGTMEVEEVKLFVKLILRFKYLILTT